MNLEVIWYWQNFKYFYNFFFLDPDNVPEPTSSIQQVITPSKGTTTTIEGSDFSLAIRKPIAVVQHLMPLTPHKALSAEPDIASNTTDKLKRGETIDDHIRLEFLKAWIQFSEYPFGFCISQHKKLARHTIEKLMRWGKKIKKLEHYLKYFLLGKLPAVTKRRQSFLVI